MFLCLQNKGVGLKTNHYLDQFFKISYKNWQSKVMCKELVCVEEPGLPGTRGRGSAPTSAPGSTATCGQNIYN